MRTLDLVPCSAINPSYCQGLGGWTVRSPMLSEATLQCALLTWYIDKATLYQACQCQ